MLIGRPFHSQESQHGLGSPAKDYVAFMGMNKILNFMDNMINYEILCNCLNRTSRIGKHSNVPICSGEAF